jgi:hypothetical protein
MNAVSLACEFNAKAQRRRDAKGRNGGDYNPFATRWIPSLTNRSPKLMTSGLSALNFRVDGFEFVSSVVDFHSPVDSPLRVIDVR